VNPDTPVKPLTITQETTSVSVSVSNRRKSRKTFGWWVSKSVTAIGLFYLLAVVFVPSNSRFKVNRVSSTEIFLFAVILLFNSGVLEKLEDFSIDGTKIQAKFQRLEAEQEQQKYELDQVQQQQLDHQKDQLHLLSEQQREITLLQERQNFVLGFALKSVIGKFELLCLERLNRCEIEQKPYIVQFVPALEVQLKNLCAVRFLERKDSNVNINSLVEELREDPNSRKDLTEYFSVASEGKQYLDLIDELGIKKDIDFENIISRELT
jgi:hypothetical protein